MGAPKQKWTPEEEQALRSGVEKYGAGKWRAIQKDPKFGAYLTQRSNVDLKDKWRNMSVAAGSGAIVVIPKEKSGREGRAAAAAAREAIKDAESDGDAAILDKVEPVSTQQYDDMVLNAIHELKEKGGSSTVAILKHAEESNAVPPNLKRILTNRIKLLVDDGKIIKSKQNFKLSEAMAAAMAASGGPPSRGTKRQREAEESRRALALAVVPASSAPSGGREGTRSQSRREGGAGKRSRGEGADLGKLKMKAAPRADEAARLAALAVAEAEAAASAAEQAAREAEQAEAEAEQAEAAAAEAAAAVRGKGRGGAKGKL